jgi:hypothetical protein
MPNDYEKRVALLKSRASATDLLVIEAVEKAAAEITATAAVVKALREELTLEGGIEKAFRLGNSRGGVQSRGADAISKAGP